MYTPDDTQDVSELIGSVDETAQEIAEALAVPTDADPDFDRIGDLRADAMEALDAAVDSGPTADQQAAIDTLDDLLDALTIYTQAEAQGAEAAVHYDRGLALSDSAGETDQALETLKEADAMVDVARTNLYTVEYEFEDLESDIEEHLTHFDLAAARSALTETQNALEPFDWLVTGFRLFTEAQAAIDEFILAIQSGNANRAREIIEESSDQTTGCTGAFERVLRLETGDSEVTAAAEELLEGAEQFNEAMETGEDAARALENGDEEEATKLLNEMEAQFDAVDL